MKKLLALVTLSGLALGGFALLWTKGADLAIERAFAGTAADALRSSGPLPVGAKVTFLELGSVGCKPCEAMKPVMEGVRQRHGKRVDVIFHDVKRDPSIARQWRVVLIPTQVFLDSQGKEVFRHEGFLALDDVLGVLRKMGVE